MKEMLRGKKITGRYLIEVYFHRIECTNVPALIFYVPGNETNKLITLTQLCMCAWSNKLAVMFYIACYSLYTWELEVTILLKSYKS